MSKKNSIIVASLAIPTLKAPYVTGPVEKIIAAASENASATLENFHITKIGKVVKKTISGKKAIYQSNVDSDEDDDEMDDSDIEQASLAPAPKPKAKPQAINKPNVKKINNNDIKQAAFEPAPKQKLIAKSNKASAVKPAIIKDIKPIKSQSVQPAAAKVASNNDIKKTVKPANQKNEKRALTDKINELNVKKQKKNQQQLTK